MIENDVFSTVFVMFLLSTLAVIALLALFIVSVIDIYEKRFLKWIYVKVPVFLVSIGILFAGMPWWFLGFAYHETDNSNAETFHKMAIKFSVLPSVKSFMYAELGAFYMIKYKGADAIAAYEKSYDLKNNKDALVHLCLLYTIKGDTDEAIANCVIAESNQLVAINGILSKNYSVAMKVLDMKIENPDASCWDYAMRGYIFRATGRPNWARKDFAKAAEMCPKNENLQKVLKNPRYYEESYAERRKTFGF